MLRADLTTTFKPTHERGSHDRQERVHALRQRLHDEIPGVAIDHERWEQVCLTMNQAIGVGIELQRAPKLNRAGNPFGDERRPDRLVVSRQHPERNLRPVAEECGPNITPTRGQDPDEVAATSLNIDDVGAIDPRMTAS